MSDYAILKANFPLLFFYFLLGFSFAFPSISIRYFLMSFASPSQMAAMMGIFALPWVFKPIYGFVSDVYTINGYRRKPYMMIGAYFSAIMWVVLPFCPTDEFLVSVCMTFASLGLCVSDVMADSLLVEAARQENEENKGIVQSYSWIFRFTGGLVGSILGAASYDGLGWVGVFHLTSMIPCVIILLALVIPEKEIVQNTDLKLTIGKLFQAIKQPAIFKPAIFLFLICTTPSYGDIMTFFYKEELSFTPDEFGSLDVLGHVVSIVGTIIYKKYLRKIKLRTIFCWALVASFLLENTMLLLVLHVNRDWGIPDYVFAFVERIALTLASQFVTMPMVVLGAKLCPVGVEATLYALLMSITNLGGIVGSELGSMLAGVFGITAINFSNLWKLMLVCHICDLIPLSCLFLLPRNDLLPVNTNI
jgi:folate/biopterin transporter